MIISLRRRLQLAVTLILSIGSDPNLLASRSLVLKSAGHQVVTAYSIKEAASRIQEGDFDLVLFCRSIPQIERDRLTAWIRASGSRIPIVSVSLYPTDAYDGAIVGSEPAALLCGIREALKSAAFPAKQTSTLPREREAADTAAKNPSTPNTGYRQQMKTRNRRLVPVRAG